MKNHYNRSLTTLTQTIHQTLYISRLHSKYKETQWYLCVYTFVGRIYLIAAEKPRGFRISNFILYIFSLFGWTNERWFVRYVCWCSLYGSRSSFLYYQLKWTTFQRRYIYTNRLVVFPWQWNTNITYMWVRYNVNNMMMGETKDREWCEELFKWMMCVVIPIDTYGYGSITEV